MIDTNGFINEKLLSDYQYYTLNHRLFGSNYLYRKSQRVEKLSGLFYHRNQIELIHACSLNDYGGGFMACSYEERELIFNRDDLKIFGKLLTPKEKGRFPLVIICHGFGGNLNSTYDHAVNMANAGFVSYIFDFIGGGPQIQSDGTMLDMTVLTEVKDLRVVLDGLKKLDMVDPDNVFLLGESQGGFVCSYFAAIYPDEIRGLIPFYPAYVIQDDAKKRIEEYGTDREWIEVMGQKISVRYGIDATSFDLYDMLPNYTGNVLIIHGTSDSIVPLSYSERAVEAFPSAELITIEGADHGYSGDDRKFAVGKTIEFIKTNLKK